MSDEKIDMLIQIVSLGQMPALQELLSKSPDLDINQKDEDGNFAAIMAARRNDLHMLKFLVQHGAKLDLIDGFGRTVIGWAKKHRNDEIVSYIGETLLYTSKLFAKN